MIKKLLTFLLFNVLIVFSLTSAFAKKDEQVVGAVFTMTNDPKENQIIVYERLQNGGLVYKDLVSAQGKGSGGSLNPLSSQNSIILSDNKFLLAVNAGSNSIALFKITNDGLKRIQTISSGGNFPVSLTVWDNIVYVLNQKTPNITGFYLTGKGLIPIKDSTKILNSDSYAQINIDPNGNYLFATDKDNDLISQFFFKDDGNVVYSRDWASVGKTPFGFTYDNNNHLLVTEAGSGSVSTYNIDFLDDAISPSVKSLQKATCWIAGNSQGFFYTANTESNSISAYKHNAKLGVISLINGIAGTVLKPIDLALSDDGKFLYVLSPGNKAVHIFKLKEDGMLVNLGSAPSLLSKFSQGLAAY